jgi:hypothetical protein
MLSLAGLLQVIKLRVMTAMGELINSCLTRNITASQELTFSDFEQLRLSSLCSSAGTSWEFSVSLKNKYLTFVVYGAQFFSFYASTNTGHFVLEIPTQ